MPDLKRLPTHSTWSNFFRFPGAERVSWRRTAKSRRHGRGKCRRGNVFCREAGERGSATKWDEGPGETEGVSPGAIPSAKWPRINPGPEWIRV